MFQKRQTLSTLLGGAWAFLELTGTIFEDQVSQHRISPKQCSQQPFKYVICSTDGILQTGANAAERVEMVAILDLFTVEDKSVNHVTRNLMIHCAKLVLNPTRPFVNDAMKYRVLLNGGLCRGMR